MKTIILDLDGTVTPHSTWLTLNTALGITTKQDQELFDQYYQGKISYHDWTKRLMELHFATDSILSKEEIIKLAENTELRPDAIDFVRTAKNKGYHIVLLSASIDVIVEHIACRLNVDKWLACSKAIFNNDDELTNIIPMGDEDLAKLELVTQAQIELSKNTISIGDGANEKELFKRTKGILIGENKTLLPLAWKKVDNLTEAMLLI